MKTKTILLIAPALFFGSCATEFGIPSTDVPQVVTTTFQQKYPAVQNPVWEVEKADGRLVYEAAFKLEGKKKEAEFKPDGTFIKEE